MSPDPIDADTAGRPSAEERSIATARPFNLRDLGGYATRSGRDVRRRLLLRGGGLQLLDGADLARVSALGIRTAIDLRTLDELRLQGGYPPSAGTRPLHLPLVLRVSELTEIWSERLPAAGAIDAEQVLGQRYLEMLELGGETIAQALELLGRPDSYPAVIFCAAGKDRTGLLAALVLGLLEVDDLDIARDYALSAAPVIEMARSRAEHQLIPPGMPQESVPVALSAPPGAIVVFLAGLRERFGSLEGYVERLGLPASTLAALRGALLE